MFKPYFNACYLYIFLLFPSVYMHYFMLLKMFFFSFFVLLLSFLYHSKLSVLNFHSNYTYMTSNGSTCPAVTAERGADGGDSEAPGGMEGSSVALPPKHGSP